MLFLIGIFETQYQSGEALTVTGDGEQRRDFTHVEDIADALIKIAKHKGHHIDAWELGTGINYSMNELYKIFLCDVFNPSIQDPIDLQLSEFEK